MHLDQRGHLPSLRHAGACRFSLSLLDQANNPRRLADHNDDSDVSSYAYPYSTVLDGIRGWVPRDRRSLSLHHIEDQSP
jgi:hypothetical protein